MKVNLITIISLIFLFTSCQKLERNNPFDPECSLNSWTPVNFLAVQEGMTVKLTWDQPNNNISGFYLTKQIDLGTLIELQSQSKNTFQYVDASLIGGKIHNYTIKAYAGSNQSYTIAAQITPKLTAGITTAVVNQIDSNSAQSGGTISNDGGAPITARGVCWNTSLNPTIVHNKSTDGTGIGTFSSSLIYLTPGVTYYLRAYATNSAGTAYGNELSFSLPTLPTLTTTTFTAITSSTAISGGNITSAGGGTVTSRGVCWSNYSGPTVANSKTTDGSGVGSFISSISSLIPGTTYYARSYATNSTGTSYGNELSFTTKSVFVGNVTDVDGNIYSTVQIGSQVWMSSNLKTTKFKDGSAIPMVTNNYTWAGLTTPGYCWYDNSTSNKNTYGALYNWYAVNTGKLCPIGWHVPSDTEWSSLTTYIGGESVSGGKLKETGTFHWQSPNMNATNETAFSAVPGGGRFIDVSFYNIGLSGVWWSTSESSNLYGWYRGMSYINGAVNRYSNDKRTGYSVRCMKN